MVSCISPTCERSAYEFSKFDNRCTADGTAGMTGVRPLPHALKLLLPPNLTCTEALVENHVTLGQWNSMSTHITECSISGLLRLLSAAVLKVDAHR